MAMMSSMGVGRNIWADSVFPKKCHENVCVGGGKGTADGCAIDLVIEGVMELETIVFEECLQCLW